VPPKRNGVTAFRCSATSYKPDFKHLDYVNPNAPKGGSVRQLAIGTFDNFNLAWISTARNSANVDLKSL
jgi:microcin C transport system substrate-binding protein